MFKAISTAIGGFWPQSPADDHQATIGETDNTDFMGSAVDLETGNKILKNDRRMEGKITSVQSEHGLIDHDIYFDLSLVNGVAFKVGDSVSVVAERSHEAAGWKAVQVTVLNYQEDDETTQRDFSSDGEGFVGRVTKVNGDTGVINGNTTFNLADTLDDYIPRRGDWVKAETRNNESSEEQTAFNVQPLRRWETEGQVDYVCQEYGFVTTFAGAVGVYFSVDTLCDQYIARRGDRVKVIAVEVSGGKNNWRAIRVEPAREIDRLSCLNRVEKLQMSSPSSTERISQLLKSKERVTLSTNTDFGEIVILKSKTIRIFISNDGERKQTLIGCRPFNRACGNQFTFDMGEIGCEGRCEIYPGDVIPINITCKAKNLGADKQLILFEFSSFKMATFVTVKVTDPNHRNLEPIAPYQRNQAAAYNNQKFNSKTNKWVLQGPRPQMRNTVVKKLPTRLPHYDVTEAMWNLAVSEEHEAVPQLAEPLKFRNYTSRFSALLHLEEVQQELDMREFDMQRVCLRNFGEFLALLVPGLAEGRPSVLVGDKIYLTTPGDDESGPQYEGYVHEVMNMEILIKFHQEFHCSYNGEDYNVRFQFNRTPMRRCHQAVEFAPLLGKQVLFPTDLIPKVPYVRKPADSQLTSPLVKPSAGLKRCPLGRRNRTESTTYGHEFLNKALNPRQRSAVMRILNAQCRPTPYIIFGPPGTGKTVTFVEAILQVFHHIPSSRIIACAPSNSAADLLAERLSQSNLVKVGDIVRLNAFRRTNESIPEKIKTICSDGEDLELVARHRIIICTCSTAGQLYSLGLNTGHFTHAFIDEAGQATEPEAMIPIGLVAGEEGQVVLAGDPMQLGPVLRSKKAKLYGLDLSLLERLIYSPLYARDEKKFADHGCYDPLLVTKLVENYRSHPALLSLSSRLFYHGELEVSGDPALIECLTGWEELPERSDVPLVFHGMRGEDLREGNSPSWFNSVEAVQVMKYLQSLVHNTTHQLSFDDIGIITPYRKQVEKIRLLIDRLGMDKVKVGSVEEFQGQERLVMIISTVRSTEAQVSSDIIHNLGFLSNPKRFNVSITRAQALLIVIGNPHVLAQDPMWRELIVYCVKNKAYIGCDLPDLGVENSNDEIDAQNNAVNDVENDAENGEEVISSIEGLSIENEHKDPVIEQSEGFNDDSDEAVKAVEAVEWGMFSKEEESVVAENEVNDNQSAGSQIELDDDKGVTVEVNVGVNEENTVANVGIKVNQNVGANESKGTNVGANAENVDTNEVSCDTYSSEDGKEHEDAESVNSIVKLDGSTLENKSFDESILKNLSFSESVPSQSSLVGLKSQKESSTETSSKKNNLDVSALRDNSFSESELRSKTFDEAVPQKPSPPKRLSCASFIAMSTASRVNTSKVGETSSTCSPERSNTPDSSTESIYWNSPMKINKSGESVAATFSQMKGDSGIKVKVSGMEQEDAVFMGRTGTVVRPGAKNRKKSKSRTLKVNNAQPHYQLQESNSGFQRQNSALQQLDRDVCTEDEKFTSCSASFDSSYFANCSHLHDDWPNGNQSESRSASNSQSDPVITLLSRKSNCLKQQNQEQQEQKLKQQPKLQQRDQKSPVDFGEHYFRRQSRDWFPSAEKWVKRTDQSRKPSIFDSVESSRRKPRPIRKHPLWYNLEAFFEHVDKESESYRHTHSSESERPKKSGKNVKQTKRRLVQKKPGLGLSSGKDTSRSKIEGKSNNGRIQQETVFSAVQEGNGAAGMDSDSEETNLQKDRNRSRKSETDSGNKNAPTELEQKIIRQVEYYFGDYNLPKDDFLQRAMRANDGWVLVETVASFNQMRKLTMDSSVIQTALRKSKNQIIQLSRYGNYIKRHPENPLPSHRTRPQDMHGKSIFVKGLPPFIALENLEVYFQQWGKVDHVESPTFNVDMDKDAAVIVFKDVRTAEAVMGVQHVYEGSRLQVYRSNSTRFLTSKKYRKIGHPQMNLKSRNYNYPVHTMFNNKWSNNPPRHPPGKYSHGSRDFHYCHVTPTSGLESRPNTEKSNFEEWTKEYIDSASSSSGNPESALAYNDVRIRDAINHYLRDKDLDQEEGDVIVESEDGEDTDEEDTCDL